MSVIFHTWNDSANDGDITNVNNYTDDATGLTSANAPATGDTVSFISSTRTLTGSLSSATLVSLYFGPAFQGNIGSSGVACTFSATTLTYEANCSFANITAGSGNIAKAKLRGGNFTCSGGTYTQVEAASGTVTVNAGCTVTNWKGCGASGAAGTGTAFTTVDVFAGTLTTARTFGTGRVGGQGSLLQGTGLAAITTAVYITGGARYNHQSKGTITLVDVAPGSVVDDLGNPYRAFTVTNANVWYGAKYFPGAVSTITASNAAIPVGSNQL